MERILKVSLYVLALSLLMFITNAELQGDWPELDKPPPPVASWTALVDQSKVPNAPISKGEDDCPANDEFCKWSCSQCTRNDIDVVYCPNKGDWGLTFDDGPTEYTDKLLDYFASNNITTTFFVVGSRVQEYPEILKKAYDNGHQIGVHTWSHPHLTTQSNEQIIAEIKWTEVAIKAAIGVTPTYMRPPYGDSDDRVRGILSQLGYKSVVWDRDTNDWLSQEDKTFNLDWIEGNFTDWVKKPSQTGHISLEHDLYEQTAAKGPVVAPIVQDAGYIIKPIASCLGDSKPYAENVPTANASTTSTTAVTTTPPTSTDPTQPSESPSVPVPISNQSPATSNVTTFSNNINNLLSLVLLIIGTFMIM